ncbi:uncharacterized protein I206_102791 [Kwoniella pini CBS 10737]|uniref:Uncharacterized protein n=1 Tax=Kwoniella pini CBS 10737 TaxID=1296096 RepID=A0A1B9I6C9_9TREE|nr:uncharacterized protein I206_03146 [Kwoniella pini CBS 10737]OCF51080.1 hypothetical protein I206_03146 [Kwoniella pini CBS 10737]
MTIQSENALLKQENDDLKAKGTNPRAGVNITNLGPHCISTPDALERVGRMEEERAAKKQKKSAKEKGNNASNGPIRDPWPNPFVAMALGDADE